MRNKELDLTKATEQQLQQSFQSDIKANDLKNVDYSYSGILLSNVKEQTTYKHNAGVSLRNITLRQTSQRSTYCMSPLI